MLKNRLILVFLLLLNSVFAHSQNAYISKHRVEVRTGINTATEAKLPFLQRTNQYGVIPNESHTANASFLIKKDYDSLYTYTKKLKKLGFGYELEPWVNVGKVNSIHLLQGYGKLRYGAFEIYGGRRKEIQGLVDSSATMGSYIWSGNAIPIPKIEVSIPEYTPIIGKGLISIKGNFAHGWFGKGDSVQQVLLHQKSFYGRLGKPNWKLKIFAGFNHQVQWGGYPTRPFFDNISKQWIRKYTDDFDTFFKVVTGFSVPGSGVKWNEVNGVNANEAGNRFGNHLGTVDIAMSVDLGKYLDLFIYRQSLYDDGSLFHLNNILDGLNGISFKIKNGSFFKKINFEYLNTSNQGGNYFFIMANELRGNDNYFNNGNYTDGWTYQGRTIGNALLFPNREAPEMNNKKGINEIVNNRVKAININNYYQIKTIDFQTKLLLANNLGTFSQRTNTYQYSVMQEVKFSAFNIFWRIQYFGDFGSTYNSNSGITLQASKRFL